jgi:hypothetical protein
MSQLISNAANSTYDIFDTLIPSLNDTADIIEAFKLYHYGKANYFDNSEPAQNSIYKHLESLKTRAEDLEEGIALAPLLFMGG